LENKIAQNPKDFTSSSSLRETLGLFLYRYCLLDATEIVLENEVQLVEAAFGRIKIFGGTARTVLDEPFVLKATFNYFQEKDPSLVSAAERAMLHSNNASDVFLGLLRKLYDLKERAIIGSIVRDEFVSVREKLAAHNYPNFSANPSCGSSWMKPKF
ncbi:hypothetical protein BG006_002262, partial [Podila minutissima]